MTSREIIKLLEKDGWSLVRVKGDHHHFKKPGVAFLVTVPHPTKDIKPGTLRKHLPASWLEMAARIAPLVPPVSDVYIIHTDGD